MSKLRSAAHVPGRWGDASDASDASDGWKGLQYSPLLFFGIKNVNCETHKMDQNGSFPPQIHISSGSSRLEAAPIFMLVTGLDEPQHSPS